MMSLFMRLRNSKLRTKLLMSYLLVVLLPIMFISYFLISRTRDTILEQTYHINKIAFEQLKTNIEVKLNDYTKISNSILSDRQLISYLEQRYTFDVDYFESYFGYIQITFSKFKTDNPYGIKLSIYTTNNTILPDNENIFLTTHAVKNQGWYQETVKASGLHYIRTPYLSPSGNQVFSISRVLNPINNPRYSNISILEVPETQLFKLIEKEKSNKDIYLIDDDGVIISSTQREFVGKKHTQVPNLKDTLNQYFDQGMPQMLNRNVVFYDIIKPNSTAKVWKLVSIVSSDLLYKDLRTTVNYSLLIVALSALVAIIMIIIFSSQLTKRLRKLVSNMVKIRHGKFDVFVDYQENDEIGELSRSFKEMIDRINHLISKVYVSDMRSKDLELKRKQAEINALQSQINPHFLFNTMESICMNVVRKGDFETSDIIRNFAVLLRKSIEWGNDKITLKQELDIVESYLKIQKFRYRDKISYKINVDNSFEQLTIPKFTLQPIVENSVYHGIEKKAEGGEILIYAERRGNQVSIIVEDDGVGIEKNRLIEITNNLQDEYHDSNQKNIGLKNVHQRLKLYYGEQFGLFLTDRRGGGTHAEVAVPLNMKEGSHDV